MVSADFDSYYEAQRGIDARWQVVPAWTRASILNVARMAVVLLRPHHPRICRGYLERAGARDRAAGGAGAGRAARSDALDEHLTLLRP